MKYTALTQPAHGGEGAVLVKPSSYFFLCRFLRSFFLRLWVAILCLLRFLPQGTWQHSFRLILTAIMPGDEDMVKGMGEGRTSLELIGAVLPSAGKKTIPR